MDRRPLETNDLATRSADRPTGRLARAPIAIALGTFVALAALAVLPVAGADRLAAGPDVLVGSWRLDPDRSQSLREALHNAVAGRHRSEGFGGPPPGGGPGGGGPPGSGMPRGTFRSPVADEDVERLGGDAEAPATLRIAYAAPRFTFELPGDRRRVFVADGSKLKETRPDGAAVRVRATFAEGELHVVERPAKGPERSEVYRVAATADGGRQMIVVVSLAGYGPLPPVSIRRVYLPAIDGGPADGERPAPPREPSGPRSNP